MGGGAGGLGNWSFELALPQYKSGCDGGGLPAEVVNEVHLHNKMRWSAFVAAYSRLWAALCPHHLALVPLGDVPSWSRILGGQVKGRRSGGENNGKDGGCSTGGTGREAVSFPVPTCRCARHSLALTPGCPLQLQLMLTRPRLRAGSLANLCIHQALRALACVPRLLPSRVHRALACRCMRLPRLCEA
jgi:hypothetical protein